MTTALTPGVGPQIGSPWMVGLAIAQETLLSEALVDLSGITPRIRLAVPQVISLSVGNPTFQSVPVAVPPLTSELSVVLRLPTTALPQNWDASSIIRVNLVYVLDGVQNRLTNDVTGGIHLDGDGIEAPEYRLVYNPTRYYVAGVWRRIGEFATTRSAYVLLEWIIGSIETTLLLADSSEALAPLET